MHPLSQLVCDIESVRPVPQSNRVDLARPLVDTHDVDGRLSIRANDTSCRIGIIRRVNSTSGCDNGTAKVASDNSIRMTVATENSSNVGGAFLYNGAEGVRIREPSVDPVGSAVDGL